ncbi:MAG: undecaprenyl-diphosphatase UppP [Polyangiaceae bacterium]|nr:undecaprenyl-diphosphatase UppP [Polyangiaceae bacterium]
MSLLIALVLGVVEGLTEFLPVSSTGHLVLAEHLLGAAGEASASFAIVIQLGALLAVVVHYRALLGRHARGALRAERESLRLFGALVVAFLPVAVVGLLLRKVIKAHLFGVGPVVVALVTGGVVMIASSLIARARRATRLDGLAHVTLRRALVIGAGQCLSLWPGTSRSMCTILAGEAAGLSTTTAAEFSFLLSLPTLGAATVYELAKSHRELAAGVSAGALVVGMVTSFLVAWAVIAGFLRLLPRVGLWPFGVYRVALGAVVALALYR